MDIIYQGAEAVLYKDKDTALKKRISKSYRIKEIDKKIISHRTKIESNILKKLKKENIPVPEVFSVSNSTIKMQFIEGKTIRERLNKSNYKEISKKIGKTLSEIHNLNIVHGDPTTSNMILNKDKIYFIDFGLADTSKKIENKAVDLKLLKEALNSSHSEIAELCFKECIEEYKKNINSQKQILPRLEKMEKRGRYK